MDDAGSLAVRTVAGAFEGWAARDLEAMVADLAEDFVQWHSHIGLDFTLSEHQAMLRKVLRHAVLDYHDITYVPLGRGEAVLVRCRCDVRVINGEASRNVPFALIYHLRDGKIYRCEEYMDGASLPDMSFLASQ